MGRNITLSRDPSESSRPKNSIKNMIETIVRPTGDRIVYLHGEVDEPNIGEIQRQLIELSTKSKLPITIVISTYGGSMDEMFSLYDVMNMLKCPVRTVGLGKIMSAGVLLLAAGEKGNRLLGKNSRIMMHSIWTSIAGNIFEIINETEELRRSHDQYLDLLVDSTKMDKSYIEDMMNEKVDRYITPQMAIELGIVDKII